MINPHIILGGPGTGKTTRMIRQVEEELERGVPPDRIAYVAFTRAAAYEARDRACDRFGFAPDELPHFRTLHSLAYREIGATRAEIMGKAQYDELGELLGLRFSGGYKIANGPATSGTLGDRLRAIEEYARSRCATLEEAYADHGEGVDWWVLRQYAETLARYKLDVGRRDFTDLLTAYLDDGGPIAVDVAIVDEAQDLTALQWRIARKAFATTPSVYVAGDDDQAVHRWAGADVDAFLALEGDVEVLEESHRLPIDVFEKAARVLDRIGARRPKPYRHTGKRGVVDGVVDVEDVDLGDADWLLLARNGGQLRRYVEMCRLQGIPYATREGSGVKPSHVEAIRSWEALRAGREVTGASVRAALAYVDTTVEPIGDEYEHTMADLKELGLIEDRIWHDAFDRMPIDDREFYLGVLRLGRKLTDPPRVRISTIHSAKGLEADNVLVTQDLSPRTAAGLDLAPDDEHRVWYVAATRARERLVVAEADSALGYPLWTA